MKTNVNWKPCKFTKHIESVLQYLKVIVTGFYQSTFSDCGTTFILTELEQILK